LVPRLGFREPDARDLRIGEHRVMTSQS
jgi:hypothetical protein